MLGLCARAGKVLSGEPAAEQAVKKKNAYLVLIDEEASENAKKALSDACAYYGAPLRTLPAGCLGQAIGKPGRMAAAMELLSELAGQRQILLFTCQNREQAWMDTNGKETCNGSK